MKLLKSLLILIILFIDTSFAQNSPILIKGGYKDSVAINNGLISIDRIEINDGFISNAIIKIINAKIDKDTIFRTKGYIRVNILGGGVFNGIEVSRRYHINSNYRNFDNYDNDLIYPNYYTILENKPILFFHNYLDEIIMKKFSMQSKIKFKNFIETYLFPKVNLNKVDEDKFSFRPSELVQIHGGIMIFIPVDKNICPIVSDVYNTPQY
jgi:hypothetical protein